MMTTSTCSTHEPPISNLLYAVIYLRAAGPAQDTRTGGRSELRSREGDASKPRSSRLGDADDMDAERTSPVRGCGLRRTISLSSFSFGAMGSGRCVQTESSGLRLAFGGTHSHSTRFARNACGGSLSHHTRTM